MARLAAVSALLSAVALAVLIVLAPQVAVMAAAIAPAVGLLAMAAVAVRSGRRRLSTEWTTTHADSDGRFRLARTLFYVGLATIGILQYRLAGFAISDVAFLAAFALVLAEAASRRSTVGLLPGWLLLGLGLFVLGAVLSTAENSLNPGESYGVMVRFAYLVTVWFWTAAAVLRTPAHIQNALGWFVVGAAMAGAWAVGQKLGLLPLGNAAPPRLPGSTEHVNDLGGLCAVAAVPALALAFITRRAWAYACLLFVGAGLALSGSIGAVAALALALAACMLIKEMTTAVVVSVVVCSAAVAFLASQNLLEISQAERIEVVTSRSADYGQGTVFSRIDVYDIAVERIAENPLAGTGMDLRSSTIYSPTSGVSHQVHNLFLGRLYEVGLLGFLGVLIIVGGLIGAGWRGIVRAASQREQIIAVALLASVFAFLAFSMTSPALYKRIMLAPAALVVASSARHHRAMAGRRDRGTTRIGAGLSSPPQMSQPA